MVMGFNLSVLTPAIEQSTEHAQRLWRSLRIPQENAARKALVKRTSKNPALSHFVDRRLGYRAIPHGLVPSVDAAVRHAQKLRNEHTDWGRGISKNESKMSYNPTICMPRIYEEAPAFFELALSDEIVQMACEYLGEVPILNQIRLWWTPVNSELRGSQLFHRDSQTWTQRRAKFIFAMDTIGPECGPFTFLTADASERVAKGIGNPRKKVDDELVFKFAKREELIEVTGQPGAGMFVDTSRCYHFGARARGGERLALMFQFLKLRDRLSGHAIGLSPGFFERYQDDLVRRRMIHKEPVSEVQTDE
jgi:hypothetical protein